LASFLAHEVYSGANCADFVQNYEDLTMETYCACNDPTPSGGSCSCATYDSGRCPPCEAGDPGTPSAFWTVYTVVTTNIEYSGADLCQ
jgi:hypothetical protein